MSTTGERIKELRIKNGMTQEELGALLGVQGAAINKYEKGTVTNLRRSTIENLAKIFRVSPMYILEGYEVDELTILYEQLSREGKNRLLEYAQMLHKGGYTK